MFHVARTSRSLVLLSTLTPSRPATAAAKHLRSKLSSSTKAAAGPLEGDTGALATRIHHKMTVSLAVLTPLFFLIPDSYSDGVVNKLFGLLLTTNITAHSWIGLNYVATDYVPKISKALLGPARYVNAGLAVVTFLGLAKISLASPGGIKAVVKGVWNPLPHKKESDKLKF